MSAKISLFTILALLSFGILMPAMTVHAQTYDNNYACSDNPYDNLPPCSNYYDYSYDYPDWGYYPFLGFDFDFDHHHRDFDRHGDFDRFGHSDFDRDHHGFVAGNHGSTGGWSHGGGTAGGMHAGGGFHGGGGHR